MREAEDTFDWQENHDASWSLWPTWTNKSTGLLGPYETEPQARSAALLLLCYRRAELLRLTLQRPDGSAEELIALPSIFAEKA